MTRKQTSSKQKPVSTNGDDTFRLVFLNNPLPMWIYDLETLAFLEVNNTAVRCYGYSRDEFLAMTIKNIRPSEDVPRLLESVARSPEGLEQSGEWRHQLNDGRVIDVTITSHTLLFKERKAKLVVAVDITERKRAENALRESEARYRNLVENSQDLICTHDLEGNLLSVNEAASRMSGYARDKLLDMNLADLLDPKVRSGLGATLTEIRTTGRARGIMRVRTARGETRYLEYDGSLRSEGVGASVVHGAARDVTDRVQAEKILQKKTEELERYFTTALDLFCIADTDGYFRRLNKQWEAALGYPLEELEGRRFLDFVHPDDVEATVQTVSRLAGQQKVVDFVNRYRRKDGSYRWIEWRASPAGNLIYAAARDVTEHKRVEDALRESEGLYRSLFENMLNGFAYCQMLFENGRPRDFIYLAVNDAFETLTGLKNVVGRRVTEVIPGIRESDQQLFEIYGRVAMTGQSERFETFVEALQMWFWISVYSPAREYFVAVFDVITERKQAEADLRETQERLQRTVSAGNVGLWDLDLRTNQIYYSPEWKRQIGYENDEISGSLDEWRTLIHPEDRDRAFAALQACLTSPWPAYESEFRVRHKNGSYRLMLARGAVSFDDQGRPVRMLGSRVDITERADIEAQLSQAQRMESVGRLAGGIAHDFNNLLTVINGIADLAMMKLREGDPQRADLQEIRRAGERAAALTKQLLAFSRRQIMKLEVFTVTSLAANMRDMLQRLIGEDVELVVVPAKGVGSVRADPGQIEQVVMNLAVNARDAMPKGGTLTIEVSDVELDEAYAAEHPSVQPGPHVMLAVSDTGIGMDEATRARIFEPFFTTKDPGKGTGLGLSTAYGIVKQSGGSIWVYSELGKGTTFKIYLPRVDEAAHKAQLAPTTTSVRGTETVLIVEDEELVRRLAQRILKSTGYTVLTASNGGEALLLLEHHDGPVHLMITDVVMPGMSGRELAERLGSIRPGMKVLYTSGYTDDAIVRHGVLGDATHFVGKPYSMAELTRKVREVLDSARPATA